MLTIDGEVNKLCGMIPVILLDEASKCVRLLNVPKPSDEPVIALLEISLIISLTTFVTTFVMIDHLQP